MASGVSKEDAELDDWMKDVAPSDDLREWFDHDPERWETFVERYRSELAAQPELVQELADYARSGTLTLLYAAVDQDQNNTVVLADYIQERVEGE